MRDAAQWAALVIDSSKFNRTAMMRVLPIEAYDAVVVDDGIAPDDLESLRSLDLDVHVAPTVGGRG
jgi:DeoR/GlpR family transcriptional regulator of sugar metabolism